MRRDVKEDGGPSICRESVGKIGQLAEPERI